MNDKIELKPCPFCGGKAAIGTLFHSRDNMVKYTMKCSGCGVLTPLYKTKKKPERHGTGGRDMMINDAKTCNCTTNDSDSVLQRTNTMLSHLRCLTECLHDIESKIIDISNTFFFETSKEREYTEPKDINTEIIHDHEVALAIIDALSLLETGIGINQ